MSISMGLVKGFGVGLEYIELDEDDSTFMGVEADFMAILTLGFVRFTYVNDNGYSDED